jgi:hypothetical protein
MAARPSRLRLIDLLMIVVLCAPIAATLRWFLEWRETIGAPEPPRGLLTFGGFVGLFFSFLAWSIAWQMIRASRAGPACRECGRRFLPAAKKGDAAERCLSCRQRSFGPAELKKEETKGRTGALVLLACVTILTGFGLSGLVAAHSGGWNWFALPLVSAGAVVGSIVRDRGGRVMERVVAVRELGRAGYATGADALIDLLREPGEMPVEEVLWSLRAISGLDLGANPEFWWAWFSSLPDEVVAPLVTVLDEAP